MEQKTNRTVAVSKLTAKCQATIPKAVRDRLGVDADDQIAFVVDDKGQIVLEKSIKKILTS